MDNNFIFYRLRKINDWDEEKMRDLFQSVDFPVSPLSIFAWMKRDIYEGFEAMPDIALAALLNAFVLEKRGKKEGETIVNEEVLTNNLILRKIKIAYSFRDDDIIECLRLADIRIGKAELSAFFRDKKHSHYRICGDQFLRNLIKGIELKELK